MLKRSLNKTQLFAKIYTTRLAGAVRNYFSEEHFDRMYALILVLCAISLLIIARLFTLQVVDHPFYAALASDQHEIQAILQAKRGDILMRDAQSDQLIPVATDKAYVQLYSVPKQITDPEKTAEQLAPYVKLTKERMIELFSKKDDPYEPIEKKVSKERFEKIKELNLAGIHAVEEMHRYYVDDNISSHVIGFLGMKDEEPTGFYGIEGYFNNILSGIPGFFSSEKDVAGRWIVLSNKDVIQAQDGANIVLTMDHTAQYVVCQKLNEAVERHGAAGGAAIVLEPETGKILSMCSAPDFNLNYYYDVESAAVYNNKAIFEAYEPGSVFKPIVMAAAVDLEYVTPDTTYVDPGAVEIDDFTIRNADDKVYGEQTMVGVLENSINTGMIHVARLIGQERFRGYLERFGFGEPTGIELQTEVAGNIKPIYSRAEIYQATASFGQGITVTPLQMAAAYGAIANGGKLMKPYIVEEIRHADGKVEKRSPQQVRQVLSTRASVLMTGMLTSVVTNGHAGLADVDGYYVAGKTGTAQIAGPGGKYLEDATNHSFVGFAPADDPKFVIFIRLEKPTSAPYSASTAAPLFSDIAEFLLNYYAITPDY